MRRSHDALSQQALSVESASGEVHLRHNITPEGYYKGNKVIESKLEQEPESEEDST